MTPYMEFHPGGEEELMRGVGKDATDLFIQVRQSRPVLVVRPSLFKPLAPASYLGAEMTREVFWVCVLTCFLLLCSSSCFLQNMQEVFI